MAKLNKTVQAGAWSAEWTQICFGKKIENPRPGQPSRCLIRVRRACLTNTATGVYIKFVVTTSKGVTHVSDSRQKDPCCAIHPAFKGYTVPQWEQELRRYLGAEMAKQIVWDLAPNHQTESVTEEAKPIASAA